jgi:hypothetical protein
MHRALGRVIICDTGASVVAVAERLKATRVATLDHRHFRAVRPAHCDAFELLPAR